MKKTTLFSAAMLMLSCVWANAQTVTVIDPAGDGGFESGAEFADNGWTVQNAAYGSRRWHVGTGQPGFSGNRGAFIGSSATNVGTNAGGRTAHFYRAITIPADAVNVQLKFKYKQEVVVIDPTTGPNDYILLSLMDVAPTTASTPTSSQFGGKFPSTGPIANFTEFTVPLPEDAASGEVKYLVFTFKSTNLNTAGTIGWPAIDDIELTYDGVASIGDFSADTFKAYPNPVNDVLTLSSVKGMNAVTVTNMLGQQVISKTLGNVTDATVDTSSLAKGTYLITIQGEGGSKTLKIVK